MIKKIVWILQSLLDLNKAIEELVINLVASISPWLTPLVPAMLTWQSVQAQLNFPIWSAWVAAAVIETLGLSSVSTTISFFNYNRSKLKTDSSAPVWLALLTGLFYLGVTLSVNVMLDPNSTPGHRLAKGLLSSLSVCAGVILALRSSQTQRERKAAQDKQERHEARIENAKVLAVKSTQVINNKICEYCGNGYQSSNPNSKYCCSNHKLKAFRLKQKGNGHVTDETLETVRNGDETENRFMDTLN
jgi:hypothetical protein